MPNSSTLRKWIYRYQAHTKSEEQEPTTVCLYTCGVGYGGPEEGGWYFETGYPLKTICVFSKKQAIREAILLEEEAEEEHGCSTDYLGWPAWRVCFDNKYGEAYPTKRPYYC